MQNGTNQVDVALDKMTPKNGLVVARGADDIQTPFPTSLILTREQEDKLVEHVLQRVNSMEIESGRVNVVGISGGAQVPRPDVNTHMGKRELFTLRYQNYVKDRATGAGPENPNTIYDVSNLTAGLSQRMTMQMAARANNYFFGTDPWFSIGFVGREDQPLSERIDRHAHWKFNESGLRNNGKKAVEYAFVRGEAVMKTAYLDKTQYYQKKGQALFDGDKPVLDVNGNYIFSDAKWVPELQSAPTAPGTNTDGQGQGGDVAMQATGREVLKRDGVTVKPDGAQWVKGVYPVKKTTYSGPDCDLVYFKDFLCPLNAPDIHSADIVAHIYDLPVMDLVEMFRRQDLAAMGAKEGTQGLKKAIDMIRGVAGEGSIPKAAATQARSENAEQYIAGDVDNPSVEAVEAYVRYDANEDGIMEEIMVVVDRRNRFPVFYDYLGNVTVTGRRPFEVIRVKPVDGRWYGMGSMEYFQHEQEYIDLMINRRNFEMSASGRVTFWRPQKVKEGQSQPGLKLRHGKTYTPVDDTPVDQILKYVVLPDTGENMMELVNFFMQLMQLKSGTINSGDQQMSGMPTQKTATGINEVSASGQELFSQFLDEAEPGIEATVKANVYVTYGNFNQAEYFRYAKGDASIMEQLLPEDVADLDYDVTLLMTRQKTELSASHNQEAWGIATQFYQFSPPVQQRLAGLAVALLKSKQIDNAQEYIQPLTWADMQPAAPQQQPQQAQQAQPAI